MQNRLCFQVCVGLKGGLVQLYSQKNLVDQFQAPGEYFPINVNKVWRQSLLLLDTVLAMTFGKLGQEEHVLVLVTNSELTFPLFAYQSSSATSQMDHCL